MTLTGAGQASLLQQAGALASRRAALRLAAEKTAHSYLRGPHGRRRAGAGERFWQFRPYHPGDAPRDIDWRQTAKRDDVFVREREHDAAQTLWVWCDRSASMDYSSGAKLPTKFEQAEILMLAAALLALEGGERVGVVGSGTPARSHVSALAQVQGQLDEAPALSEGLMPSGSRGVCVLASDFYCDLALVQAACANARVRDNRVILLQICDRSEEDMPWHGRVRFEDSEAADQSLMIDDVDALRVAYREKFRAHRDALADIAHRHGGFLLTARTDEAADDVLARVVAAVTGQEEGAWAR